MSAHGSGIAGATARSIDDGTKRTPAWNAPLTAVPLNQGVQFQQEIINWRLRQEKAVAEFMKGRTNEGRKGPR
jgi:hypothetical protein